MGGSSSDHWQGATAIVTGAASGIGLNLSRALVRRGARVWMGDIDAAGVEKQAAALGTQARAVQLDVRDAAAVEALVAAVARETGRLDYMFNNAGIGIAGETQDFEAVHFDRTIDVNIRGVVYGALAAYKQMLAQGHGCIVNTASVAGLTPVPLFAAYAMSKHAVVGFSQSLRAEAALHGIRVNAICPAAIETPLLDGDGPADLPAAKWRPDVRGYLTALAGAPYPVERCVDQALRGVERDRALIVLPGQARAVAALQRFAPGLVALVASYHLKNELSRRPQPAASVKPGQAQARLTR